MQTTPEPEKLSSWILLIRDFEAEIDIPTDKFLAAGLDL
jgi:hypothetical protein